MNTFANRLSRIIKSHNEFWDDLQILYSLSIKKIIFSENELILEQQVIQRLANSASCLSQSDIEENKSLAQTIIIYLSILIGKTDFINTSSSILANIGNFPVTQYLMKDIPLSSLKLTTYLQNQLLGFFNSIQVDNKTFFLTDFQKTIWDNLSTKKSTAISAPTSAGKSFITLEHLCNEIINTDKLNIIYIAPTRALLSEISIKLTKKLEKYADDIRISTIPTIDTVDRKQLFILTQERLQVLLTISTLTFDIIVCDEAQAINDDSRGIILQDCLEMLFTRNSNARFIFLSPGAEGFETLEDAIGIKKLTIQKTELSPVIQNRIIVQALASDENLLSLSLLHEDKKLFLGNFSTTRGLANAKNRLAIVALELGSNGGSLVYGTGAADAEMKAKQIASALIEQENEELVELSNFIKKHIHKEYSLASLVLKGVGFHYGKMPSLLRESLEQAFIKNKLKYLICTTTLFQGVNLPAKNVFINTPNRGNKGDKLDIASLWNFAGRAGRLGYETCGNVFLIDYEDWDTQPLNKKIPFNIEPSFKKILIDDYENVVKKLQAEPDEKPQEYTPSDAVAGLLLSRYAKNTLKPFLTRTLHSSLSQEKIKFLIEETQNTVERLELPINIISLNWAVNPFGQDRLFKRFQKAIEKKCIDGFIPKHPSENNSYQLYVGIFSRINKYILMNNTSKFSNMLASLSLSWMNGKPFPQIISDRIKWEKKQNKTINIDRIIREMFDLVEDTLRFKYVQLGRAYIDILRYALLESEYSAKAKEIYDFPLALELGVSSTAGQIFIELGLSRITSATLENLIPNSNPTVQEAKEWINNLVDNPFNLSSMIIDELINKGLLENMIS